jgi:hypothetical protein
VEDLYTACVRRGRARANRSGEPACRDASSFTDGAIELSVRGRRVTARLAGADPFGGGDLLRTRCPGPLLSDLGRSTRLALGRIPRSALGRRRLKLHLDQGESAMTPG